MRKISLLAVLCAAATFASCSKDNSSGSVVPEGVKTYMEMGISFAQGSPTRATFPSAGGGGLDGTAEETAISDVRVYMFNSVGVLELVKDFTPGNDTEIFEATTGSKTFVALVNMGDDGMGGDYYPAATVNATTLTQFKAATASLSSSIEAIAKDNAFWMSNTAFSPVSVVLTPNGVDDVNGNIANLNNVQIEVARMVAKIGVEFDPQTQVDGTVTPSTVRYKVANNPQQTNLFATRDAAGFLATPFYQKTYVLGSTDYFREADPLGADYKTATVTSGIYDATSIGYMVENSNEVPVQGNSTFIIVNGQFVPTELFDEDGLNPTNSNPDPLGTFWRIKDAAGNYTAKFYFEEPDNAHVTAEGGVSKVEYPDGTAYWALYINDTESNLPSSEKNVIERNTAWDVKIISVSGCGESDEDDLPVDPTTPLDADTYMQAEITVADWVQRAQQGGI